jgi:hypothetical protein
MVSHHHANEGKEWLTKPSAHSDRVDWRCDAHLQTWINPEMASAAFDAKGGTSARMCRC